MTITKFICHIFVFHITSKFGIVIAIPAHDYAWWCKVVQAVWREIPQRALLWGGVRGSGEACGGSLQGLPEVWKKRQWGAETWIGNKKSAPACSFTILFEMQVLELTASSCIHISSCSYLLIFCLHHCSTKNNRSCSTKGGQQQQQSAWSPRLCATFCGSSLRKVLTE